MSGASRLLPDQCASAILALACVITLFSGCAGSGSGQVGGSVYVGVGYYDPWYWGPGYVPPPGGVGPPPPRPEHPIERPPKPTHPIAPPSRPSPPPRPPASPRPAPRRR